MDGISQVRSLVNDVCVGSCEDCCVQVVVLYVEMEESVKRQMLRATMATQHNKRAADAGSEDIWNVRTTDIDAAKCRRRYEVFRVSLPLYLCRGNIDARSSCHVVNSMHAMLQWC